jgi:2-oxoisovalerate dehydrogenase E2 component (dihydrolipoyl transacylase)
LPEDVLAALSAPAAAAAPQAAAAAAEKAAPSFMHVPRTMEDKRVDITDKVGKGMIKSMNAAVQTPFMALGEEIDVTAIFALQKALKEPALKKYGVKVTLTSFIIKAISLALNEWPIVNSKFGPADANPANYTQFGSHNITCAIDTPAGLVVPNIKDCGNLSVVEIQMELNRLVADAKAGKLSMKDMQGGTITFSNVGSIGTKDPRPILYDGQAVIGAAGRLMTLPRYNAKMEVVPRQIMNIRWVGDHRHLDGATLARFSNSFRRVMEDPGEWTLTLR